MGGYMPPLLRGNNMNAISEITLYNVKINTTNQFNGFTNRQEQEAFFNQHITKQYVKCNYIPRESTIKVRGYVEELRNSNYGSYKNIYNGIERTYYFFILKRNFKSRNTTELTIAIDVFQTYYFNFHFGECFVEREHVESDEIGEHIVQEDFELGEYVISKQQIINEYNDICYILGVSDTDKEEFTANIYGGIYQGFTLFYYAKEDYKKLSQKIKTICDSGKGDSIVFIYTFPVALLKKYNNTIQSGNELTSSIYNQILSETKTIDCDKVNFMAHNKSNTYTPRNNKLHTYPYSFIAIKNTSGEVCQLKREYFYGYLKTQAFTIDCVLGQSPTIALTPMTYKGEWKSYDNSIELHGFPLCSWNNDTFANWYAQNTNKITTNKENAYRVKNASNNIANNNYKNAETQRLLNGYSDVMGIASNLGNVLNPVNAVVGAGVDSANTYLNYQKATSQMDTDIANANIQASTTYQNEIASIMAQVQDSAILPNTCRGDTTGNGLDIARASNSFYIDSVTITSEIAKNIDMYFEMFGYRVNEVKTPQFTSRTKHNYLKTVNCNLKTSGIPHDDIDVLENLFNNGITVWHDYNYMFNYSLPNTIKNSESEV